MSDRPRVLHVVDTFGARSETFIYTYVSAHRGYDAAVVSRAHHNAKEFPFPRVYFARDPWSRRSPWHWISRVAGELTGRSLWHRDIASAVEQWRPDVIHAHFGHVGATLSSIATTARVPLITSFYGVDAAVLAKRDEWREPFRELFATGAAFLVEGPAMLERVAALGAPRSRLHLQHIAVSLSRYPPWQPAEPPAALFVGRFVEKKGLLDAMRAFARVASTVADLRFRIIGDGPDRAALEQLIAEHRLHDRVTLLGLQSHATVIDELVRSRVLIHPSVTAADGDCEGGAPTLLLEAQAVGVPIVSTRHADIPYVTAGVSGVTLCAEHDIDCLALALDQAVRDRRGSTQDRVRANHDIVREIDTLERVYDSVSSAQAPSVKNQCRPESVS
jgi:colanic acid/amylovoran biosynthesis glycosyltransferase